MKKQEQYHQLYCELNTNFTEKKLLIKSTIVPEHVLIVEKEKQEDKVGRVCILLKYKYNFNRRHN